MSCSLTGNAIICSSSYMAAEIKWWKEEYAKLYIGYFITTNPTPWSKDAVDNMIKGSLETWMDSSEAGMWEDTLPDEAFAEDMSYWGE